MWSRKHRSWLTSVRFADRASQVTFADYLHAHDVLVARRDQVEAELAKLATSAPCAQAVARLRCLRGIDTLTALGLCAEIGEWGRFDHPDQLGSYLGIVPSEHTTGSQRRLGSITKAGSTQNLRSRTSVRRRRDSITDRGASCPRQASPYSSGYGRGAAPARRLDPGGLPPSIGVRQGRRLVVRTAG